MLKKGEQTREHILTCAEKVFSQKGYYQTQVSDISDIAHVAKGTVYQYFNNKESLFTTLLENYLTAWENDVKLDLNDFMGTGSAKDYARAYVRHRLSKTIVYFSMNQDRSNIILRMSLGLNEVIEQVIRLFEDKVLKSIMEDIKIGQNFGHISKDLNVEMASNLLLGGVLRMGFFYFVIKKESYIVYNQESFTTEFVKLTENTLGMSQY